MLGRYIAIGLAGVVLSALPARATTYFVDLDAPPGGDGSSWPLAFQYLQDALQVAVSGDEIRVAQGTYHPDERSDWPPGGWPCTVGTPASASRTPICGTSPSTRAP